MGDPKGHQGPVLRRLMLPLTVVLVLLISGAAASLLWQYRHHLEMVVKREITGMPEELAAALKQQARWLEAELRVITRDEGLRQALKARDRERLLSSQSEVFEKIRHELGITHFYFHAPDRENILRVYNPAKIGGRIDRFTLLEAERTGRVASGLELGSMGSFTLRVVQPVFDAEGLIGYVELGKEIEDLLKRLHTPSHVELAISIHKHLLDRENWAAGMRMLGRHGQWDFHPQKVLIYSSLASFPQQAAPFLTGETSAPDYRDIKFDADRKAWRMGLLPFKDASGREVGDLIILHDISAQRAAFIGLLVLSGAGALVLLVLLLGFFHVVLSRTDQGIMQREQEVRASERRYRLLFQNLTAGFALHEIILDRKGTPRDYRFLEMNPAFEQFAGLKADELLGRLAREVLPGEEPPCLEEYSRVAATLQPLRFERGGREAGRDYEITAYAPEAGQVAAICVDITDRKKAEAERLKLEQQLRQAQKMEAVGRLAGGVAHDFNNKLQTVFGYTELALRALGPGEPVRKDLEEIRKAAQHSADLTRQLLAFARKQAISPQILNLNDTIASMLKMLGRLIGEQIELIWRPGDGVWPVRMDPVQIDQILANLAVNARDAIRGAGRLVVETANAELDADFCAVTPGSLPGQYVLLTVSDNGSGMDQETLASIFEPFFTTKATGEGTGLGLATVYGIVKQNAGFINAHSEPGQGATFKIYLPRAETPAVSRGAAELQARQSPAGTETVLLVEDEGALLGMAKSLLERLGYLVIAASTPLEALRLAEQHPGEIHLLLTDVIMPGMNGRELAERLRVLNPALRCLFMSGYAADLISRHGMLEEGVHFIGKPFSLEEMAIKLREVLG